jgi:hypothetical protein
LTRINLAHTHRQEVKEEEEEEVAYFIRSAVVPGRLATTLTSTGEFLDEWKHKS